MCEETKPSNRAIQAALITAVSAIVAAKIMQPVPESRKPPVVVVEVPAAMYYARAGDVVVLADSQGPSQALASRLDAACDAMPTEVRRATLRRNGLTLAASNGYGDARRIPRGARMVVPHDFGCPAWCRGIRPSQ